MSEPSPATRSLLYLGPTPTEGTASQAIILRHLKRLAAEGWRIEIIAEPGQDQSACDAAGWPVRGLPKPRWWWPGFRPKIEWSRRLHTRLLARALAEAPETASPDAILSCLSVADDLLAEIAARLAKRLGRPMTLLVHDEATAFAKDENHRVKLRARYAWTIRNSRRSWFLSLESARTYAVPERHRRILPPIPEGWRPERPPVWVDRPVRIYYVGTPLPEQFRLIGRLAGIFHEQGARLVVMAKRTSALDRLVKDHPIDLQEPPGSREDALRHLVASASALLVAHADSIAEMPRSATNFPTEWVEYCHLGLPCAIVAPLDSAVGHWARARSYVDFFVPLDPRPLTAWVRELADSQSWDRHAAVTRLLAAGEFSPEVIQAEFVKGLLRR